MTTKQSPGHANHAGHGRAPATQIQSVVDHYDGLVRNLTATRSTDVFESTVTMAQLKVLMILGTRPETRMSELAGSLHVSLSTVSGVVDKLVEAHLASRRTDDNDRRQVLVSLTNEGATFLDRFQEFGKDTLRELLEELNQAEVDQVAEAMNLLISAAERITTKENE
jgi:DNA-binding MarR family transcriptional regulator